MKRVLQLSCIPSCLWGGFIILLPELAARVYGFTEPLTDIFLWKGTGLIIFLLGVGYGVASTDPRKHWLSVAIGLAAKLLGPAGLALSAFQGEVPVSTLYLIPVNDLIWIYPFAVIVRQGIHSDHVSGTLPQS